jgi:hypothetical protein
MRYDALTSLATTYAAHIERSSFTVANRVGVHPKLFQRLQAGGGCRVDTYLAVMDWFAENWPSDLEWPEEVPRPTQPKAKPARRVA